MTNFDIFCIFFAFALILIGSVGYAISRSHRWLPVMCALSGLVLMIATIATWGNPNPMCY